MPVSRPRRPAADADPSATPARATRRAPRTTKPRSRTPKPTQSEPPTQPGPPAAGAEPPATGDESPVGDVASPATDAGSDLGAVEAPAKDAGSDLTAVEAPVTDAGSLVAAGEAPVADAGADVAGAELAVAAREPTVRDAADAESRATDPGYGVPALGGAGTAGTEPEAPGALFALPAVETDPPDRPVRPRRRRAAPAQASLFSAVLADPRPTDVAGVLAGAGQVVRMGGTARVSVVVAAEWRAGALLAAFDERGLSGSRVPTVDDNIGVRTAFCAALAPIADAWLHGTVTRPPVDFRADGLALRLWALSGGRRDSLGYLLPLPAAESAWQPLRLALRVAGFDADLLSSGPALRLVGRAQLTTLTDVLGPPPPGAPGDAWPT